MSSGRVGLKRYIIPITFDIFKPMCSICLLYLRSEDIITPRKLNSDANSMLIVLTFKVGSFLLVSPNNLLKSHSIMQYHKSI